jgi:hypothetical protein
LKVARRIRHPAMVRTSRQVIAPRPLPDSRRPHCSRMNIPSGMMNIA